MVVQKSLNQVFCTSKGLERPPLRRGFSVIKLLSKLVKIDLTNGQVSVSIYP
jgi:hypothetical protein